MLVWLGQNSKGLALCYGNIASSSIGAIQRRLFVLKNQGGIGFFGKPALQLSDLMSLTPGGQGRINVLEADKLMPSPLLYTIFLLWLLSELFENQPEIGGPDKPNPRLFL